MRRWLTISALLCAVGLVSAQAERSVVFEWGALADDPDVSARVERDGAVRDCGPVTRPTVITRRCAMSWPVGSATFRVAMGTAAGEWGPWSDPVTLTVPPATANAPGPFVLRWHGVLSSGEPSGMASHAASGSGGTISGGTIATSSLGTAAAGDLVVVTVNWYNGTFTSITDSAGGNTWTQVSTEITMGGGSGQFMRMYYSVLTTGGASFAVTLTTAGGNTFPSISADRFTGETGWTLDQVATAAPGSAATSGSTGATSTRSAANEVLVAGFGTAHTVDTVWSAGTNIAWTLGGSWPTGSLACPSTQEYFLASSAGTDAGEASWTGSAVWAARIATFSYGGGGGGGVVGPVLRGRVLTPGRILGGSALLRRALTWRPAFARPALTEAA